ncbi:hypothetical protein NL676_019893 [Syzygium grande]|nr:hypothetical protein NL676_019893 [Syzygium grande]
MDPGRTTHGEIARARLVQLIAASRPEGSSPSLASNRISTSSRLPRRRRRRRRSRARLRPPCLRWTTGILPPPSVLEPTLETPSPPPPPPPVPRSPPAAMSQVDNRNSSAAKRARTDGSRREDDWTCPSCGNVNFSFRTTCNMRNCTQPRPADHNSKSAMKPVQPPQSYSSPSPYMGAGGTFLNVYGNATICPYRPLHLSGAAPYSSGSMIGNGGMYGMPPMMDRYGLGLPMGPGGMVNGPRPGFYSDDKLQKRGADATRDNDWTCPNCGNVNFSFREVCNMRKCNTPKPGSQVPKSDKNYKQKMPEGSWKCEQCGNINYPFRTKCNKQNCGADKPSEAEKSPPPAEDENDQ